MRTRVVLAQPGLDALSMEPVATRQLQDRLADLHIVHADAALGLAIVSKHISGDWDFRQACDGLGGCGARCAARGVLLHELANDPV